MKILVTETIHRDAIKILEKENRVIKGKIDDNRDLEVLVVRTYTRVDKNTIDKLPNLRYVIRCGVGLENIDLEYCKSKNIKVYYAPKSNVNSVAEHTVLLILACLRKLNKIDLSTKRGEWDRDVLTTELKGKTIGLIGFGNIGKEVAHKLQPFDVKLLAYDTVTYEDESKRLNVEYTDVDSLLRKADVISIHTPLTKDTVHMITEGKIDLMKNGAVFINTSRGSVVDEKALIKALRNKKISHAGLDVFENEPNLDKALLDLDNVILTPHIAGTTKEAFKAMCVDAVISFLDDLK